jgi:ElaB/YqjD/DUF883 family membrane-anchored ribosome-binding protein
MRKKILDNIDTNISATEDKLMDDLRLIMENAEELINATANQTSAAAVTARERIQENLSAVKNNILSAEQSLIKQARHATKATEQYVNENPWKMIGISAFAGVIVGMLISRRQ